LQLPNTLAALSELLRHGILAPADHDTLYRGYEFLRFLENRLRIATSYGVAAVARTPQHLAHISRLLRHSRVRGPQDGKDFEVAYLEITGNVREVFHRIFSELIQR
jgi:glutamine synthetase adenylyltransferase